MALKIVLPKRHSDKNTVNSQIKQELRKRLQLILTLVSLFSPDLDKQDKSNA